ncbi:MAG: hypothetical protein R3F43_14195 [bacterium]
MALGRSLALSGNGIDAARAFGSVLDLPSRADMRRFAGNWLERLGDLGLALAADTYRVALEQRPDPPRSTTCWAWCCCGRASTPRPWTWCSRASPPSRSTAGSPGVERILQEDAT